MLYHSQMIYSDIFWKIRTLEFEYNYQTCDVTYR